MSLTTIYEDLVAGRISHEEAAALYGTNPTILRMRLGKYKGEGGDPHRLFETLDAIAEGRISRAQAAEKLGISGRGVNLSMQTWGVVRPIAEYRLAGAAARVKFEVHYRIACDFIAGRINLDRAAADAKVSDRQMRRIVIDLLDKHASMSYKDMKHLSLQQLQALASKIQAAEEIDESKARTLDKVIAGRLEVGDVVAKMVRAKTPTPRRRMNATEAAQRPGPGPGDLATGVPGQRQRAQ